MAFRWIVTRARGVNALELEEFAVPAPGRGEVTVKIRAAGVNPADAKRITSAQPHELPRLIGYEVAGVISAVGPDTEIASGPCSVGEEVLAFRVLGGWSTELTVAADTVFARPESLPPEQAANLLLAGTTASEMLAVVGASAGETVLVHGASGAVGVSLLQQAALLGVDVIGTASRSRFDVLRRYGARPVDYHGDLPSQVREIAGDRVAASLDCIGTDQAVCASLDLVADRARIVTIAAPERADAEGFRRIASKLPTSASYRDSVRAQLIALAALGKLEVPMARTYPLTQAPSAVERLRSGHPGGKLALLPED